MLPAEIKPEQFHAYPPLAKEIATHRVPLFHQLPLAFLPLLLRELMAYDWKFPAERQELDQQLEFLALLSGNALRQEMASFVQLQLPPQLAEIDWVNSPAMFSEQLTAHLWASHQIDAFRKASVEYVQHMNAAAPPRPLPTHRLGIVVIGDGVAVNTYPLFRKLRSRGVYFKKVDPRNGRAIISGEVVRRANAYPLSFGHWYIDGSTAENADVNGLTSVSYSSLGNVRSTLLERIRAVIQPGGGGPEMLRSILARMSPEDLGLRGSGDTAVLNHFQISILTEGSGTQLFSTTFVQWSAREALRRAQPLTLYARFAPRQHEQTLQELLAGTQQQVTNPQGSLVDADMGAYYTWINQQRLSGADQARFLVWFENHNEALAIGPGLTRGTTEDTPLDLSGLLKRIA